MLDPQEGGQTRLLYPRIPLEPYLRLVNDTDRPVPNMLESMSPKIAEFFATTDLNGPCLAMDLDLVEAAYLDLHDAFGGARVHFAVKANPADAVIARLVALGSAFDCASIPEIQLCLDQGVTPDAVSYGNTIKKERDIAVAHALGISLFAFDSEAELHKIARSAPGASVFCRVLSDGEGAEWPLSRKFGCSFAMAEELMLQARDQGLDAAGISFHVGSQQTDPSQWRPVLDAIAALFDRLEGRGLSLRLLNLGGGMPAHYDKPVVAVSSYGAAIMAAVDSAFGGRFLQLIVEPGRGLVGNAGIIQAEVVLISVKEIGDDTRWVYLDIGKFSGLAETMGESIRYRLLSLNDGQASGPVILAGPTCDSADVLYETSGYHLPLGLKEGDKVWIMSTGAYTTTYSSVSFNGFVPLESVCL